MSTWAYRCRPCQGEGEWWVARERVDDLPPGVQLLQVHVDGDWRLAQVDRRQAVAVDGLLLRDAVPVPVDELPPAPAPAPAVAATAGDATAADAAHAQTLQAAAISLAGRHLVVVLVPLAVVQSPGEAGMLAADLRARLGVDVVLMGQDDDGSPRYHGDPALLALLAGVPVDRMPWQALRLP